MQLAHSQCPASIAVTSAATVTPASCPSNGGFTIHDNGGLAVAYQITAGPTGYPPGSQNSNVFSDLLPGDYSVKIYCQLDPSKSTTEQITIPDAYIDVTANSVVSQICTSAQPGGTITTTAQQGSTPYQYAYFQGDPGKPDNELLGTYGTSNTFNAPTYGIYNVRVKDACGVFVTQEVSVEKNYPADLCINQAYPKYYLLNCAQVQNEIYVRFYLANGVDLATLPAAGIDIEVYANSGNCASPVEGSLLKTVHFGPGSAPDLLVPNNQNLIFKLKTPCGDVCTYCYEHVTTDHVMDVSALIETVGCPAPATPNAINYAIYADVSELSVIPITYVLRNSSGTVVGTHTTSSTNRNNTSAYFNNLQSGTYTVTATDACGKTDTDTVTPDTGTPGVLTAAASTYIGCASINGRTTMNVKITGVMANLAAATATIIDPSTSGVGTTAENQGGGNYVWTDVIPGGTYTILVDNGCGQTTTVTVTLPLGNIQNQSITASVQQLCGGTGNISVAVNVEGAGSIAFDLFDSNNDIVGSGTAPGNTFTNLPAGVYHAVAHITGCGPYDITKSDIEILSGGSLPVITKKLGVICEDGSGNPTGTGKALLAFIGAQPLQVDYRLTSQTDADYVNLTNDSDGTETIDGLLANTSYIVRVTDNCGNSNPVQISIGQLSALTTENTETPCIDESYVLSVPDMVDATYTWTKSGVTISNDRQIEFPNYDAANDGTYICNIVIGGCVTRVVTATLTGKDCTLPVTLTSFTVKKEGRSALLQWATTSETNSDHFDIEYSNKGSEWLTAGTVKSNGQSNALKTYSFSHASPFSGENLYRLKMVDFDETYSYSRVRSVTFDGDNGVVFYPNPVSNILFLKDMETYNLKEVAILNLEGKTVFHADKISGSGINIKNLPAGIYVLRLVKKDDTSITQKIVVSM